MKYKILAIVLIFGLFSCDDGFDEPWMMDEPNEFTPVFITRSNLENSVIYSNEEQTLETPGKIYRYGNYLLINDISKGVHIFDNIDPTNPQRIGFIKIPGSTDIAMKGSHIYANNSVDMVTIDISDINNPVIKNRMKDVFDEPFPPNWNRMPFEYSKENRADKSLIIYNWVRSVQ